MTELRFLLFQFLRGAASQDGSLQGFDKICEDDKGPYIAEITPIDDRIKKFKKYGVLTQLFADGKKRIHLFKYFHLFNVKNINEIVDENNIVPSTRLGVLDSSCFMEPGASVLYPDTKNIIKIWEQLKPYLNYILCIRV